MYKLVTFSGYDNATGPHIFPIEADVDRSIGHIKMARPMPPAIEQYIRNAKPIPGKTQLLIDAMGAGEYYGSNVNGDYFPEAALEHKGPDYGHQTFMHYAYPYKHHVNKDPARAYGDKVTLADYDPHMHRVLLIVRVDDAKCQDILGDLANNRYWDVSMGCKVPWDECSICKNRARNRGEYCTHLRYQMNKILQDGRRVFAYNHLPKFFDISFVTIGAEKASHVLKKVAHIRGSAVPSAELGESYYAKLALAEKKALQRKNAEIEKDVPSKPPANIQGVTPGDKAKIESFVSDCGAAKQLEQPLPTGTLNTLAQHPLRNVFATLAAMGIDLQPHEFQRIILIKQGAAELADALERKRLVFDEHRPAEKMPKWASSFTNLRPDDVSEKIAMVLAPYLKERSCFPEILAERLEKRAEFPGYSRENQWYPMTDEQKRLSSGVYGSMPASMALAAGFLVFKHAFPNLVSKNGVTRTLGRNPWLLPLLMAAGVGASVGMQVEDVPMPLKTASLDSRFGQPYHRSKTASIKPLAYLGAIPLAYIYAAQQRNRWERGEPISAVNRLIASRPDLASLAAFATAPYAGRQISKLVKGAADLRVARSVKRLAQRKKR